MANEENDQKGKTRKLLLDPYPTDGKKKRRSIIERVTKRWEELVVPLSENHPKALRELWLVAVYQAYRCGCTWSDAKGAVEYRIRRNNHGHLWQPANRRQILGSKRQEKLRCFPEEYRPEGVSAAEIAVEAPVETLMYGDPERPDIQPLVGLYARLPTETWERIEAGAKDPDADVRIPTPVDIRFSDEDWQYSFDDDVRIGDDIPW